MTTKAAKQPTGLGAAGKALWRHLSGEYVFDRGEVPIVVAACRQADDVAALEAIVAVDGRKTAGAAGQVRLHPAVVEIRQGRLALARLIGQLSLPREDERPMTAAQERASRAAKARWDATPSTTDRPWKGSRNGAA